MKKFFFKNKFLVAILIFFLILVLLISIILNIIMHHSFNNKIINVNTKHTNHKEKQNINNNFAIKFSPVGGITANSFIYFLKYIPQTNKILAGTNNDLWYLDNEQSFVKSNKFNNKEVFDCYYDSHFMKQLVYGLSDGIYRDNDSLTKPWVSFNYVHVNHINFQIFSDHYVNKNKYGQSIPTKWSNDAYFNVTTDFGWHRYGYFITKEKQTEPSLQWVSGSFFAGAGNSVNIIDTYTMHDPSSGYDGFTQEASQSPLQTTLGLVGTDDFNHYDNYLYVEKNIFQPSRQFAPVELKIPTVHSRSFSQMIEDNPVQPTGYYIRNGKHQNHDDNGHDANISDAPYKINSNMWISSLSGLYQGNLLAPSSPGSWHLVPNFVNVPISSLYENPQNHDLYVGTSNGQLWKLDGKNNPSGSNDKNHWHLLYSFPLQAIRSITIDFNLNSIFVSTDQQIWGEVQ